MGWHYDGQKSTKEVIEYLKRMEQSVMNFKRIAVTETKVYDRGNRTLLGMIVEKATGDFYSVSYIIDNKDFEYKNVDSIATTKQYNYIMKNKNRFDGTIKDCRDFYS